MKWNGLMKNYKSSVFTTPLCTACTIHSIQTSFFLLFIFFIGKRRLIFIKEDARIKISLVALRLYVRVDVDLPSRTTNRTKKFVQQSLCSKDVKRQLSWIGKGVISS